jgi:hypothetical protein
VPKKAPPLFVAAAKDDKLAYDDSVRLAAAWKGAGASSTLVTYEKRRPRVRHEEERQTERRVDRRDGRVDARIRDSSANEGRIAPPARRRVAACRLHRQRTRTRADARRAKGRELRGA